MTAATAHRWTCTDCRVAAGRSDAEETPLPEHWQVSAEGTFCLGCRRKRAAEAAVEAAPVAADRDARARLRRTALVDFEVRRAPDRTNGSIAKACRTSIPAVVAARRRLDEGSR